MATNGWRKLDAADLEKCVNNLTPQTIPISVAHPWQGESHLVLGSLPSEFEIYPMRRYWDREWVFPRGSLNPSPFL